MWCMMMHTNMGFFFLEFILMPFDVGKVGGEKTTKSRPNTNLVLLIKLDEAG